MGNSIITSNGDICIIPFKQDEFCLFIRTICKTADIDRRTVAFRSDVEIFSCDFRRASRPVNFIQRKCKAVKAVVVKIKFPSA